MNANTMKNKNLNLFISHHIFLDKKERYNLADGKIVDCIGVSVPMWYCNNEFSGSSKEIFCEYSLNNDAGILSPSVENIDGIYFVNMPQKKDVRNPNISNESWMQLTKKEKEYFYNKFIIQKNAHLLRDTKDGGAGQLSFNYSYSKNYFGLIATQIHTVIINDVSCLSDYLTAIAYTEPEPSSDFFPGL